MIFDKRTVGIGDRLQIRQIGTISQGQDGAIWGDYLFRIEGNGDAHVYTLPECREVASFALGKRDLICPHSNSVCFGAEYNAEGDEFPLLYSNIYNNYAKSADRMEGVCCVYRLRREDRIFTCDLVQIIRIGFVEDLTRWKSMENNGDLRPYGNFAVDRDAGKLHAFVMRDQTRTTQYFTFALPKLSDGTWNETYGVNVVTLTAEQILSSFDTEYTWCMQGACCQDGLIYSVEGFSSTAYRPKMQIVDPTAGRQYAVLDLWGLGLRHEPEFVDFRDGILYYADSLGNLFTFTTE